MFALRFLVLLFLVAYSFSMGQSPAYELNSFGRFISGAFFVFAPALYLLPTFEAWRRHHPNLMSITLVNVFLGWSVLGWVGAIVWAFRKPEVIIAVEPDRLGSHPIGRVRPVIRNSAHFVLKRSWQRRSSASTAEVGYQPYESAKSLKALAAATA